MFKIRKFYYFENTVIIMDDPKCAKVLDTTQPGLKGVKL